MSEKTSHYDVAIVGGGAAGLSAALLLGRARRKVCVIDARQQRNLAAAESHSFFTRDGTPPQQLVGIGREQLAAYPTIELVEAEVARAAAGEGGFRLALASGDAIVARRVILATGVRDLLPDVPGLRSLWGKSVFHCPYCHGYEVAGAPIGIVLNEQDDPLALAELMRGWSDDLVLFPDQRALAPAVREELARHRVSVQEGRVVSYASDEGRLTGIRLEDGTLVPRDAALLRPQQAPRNALAVQLGCRVNADGLIEVGPELETSVAGVYAAGDCIRKMQQLIFAAADGATAAMSVNKKILADTWAREVAPAPRS